MKSECGSMQKTQSNNGWKPRLSISMKIKFKFITMAGELDGMNG